MSERDARWAWVAGLVALVLYAVTLHPGLPGGDAGELASAACAGGVAHPPGYPLHGLLLRLMQLVPVGSVLARFNFLSALCGAATAALLVDLGRRWTGRASSGALAAVAWSISPLPWLYGTTVEVFALHTLLVALVAWVLTNEVMQGGARWALALGVVGGLAVTHHQTAVFVVAPVLVARAWKHPRWPLLLGGLVLGAAPLLALPVWSGTDTPFSWGELRTVEGFITHVLRREYGTFQLASGEGATGGGLATFFGAFVQFEARQLFAAVAVLGVVGVVFAWRDARSRRWLSVALVGFGLALGVFGALANLPLDNPLFREVVARFFLLPHLMLCTALMFVPLRRATVVVAAVFSVAGVMQRPRHDAVSVKQYGVALLRQPPGALVLTQGDLIGNSTRALQACEGVEPSLRVIDQQLLSWPWYVARLRRAMPDVRFPDGDRWHPTASGAFRLQQFLETNAQRPLIVCGGFKAGDVTTFRGVPWGLCEQLVPPGATFDAEAWFRDSAAALPSLDLTDASAPRGSWEELVRRDVWNARAQRGLTALTLGIERGNDVTWLTRAYEILSDCAAHDEAPQPSVFKNLGITAGRLGRTEEMKAALRKYVSLAPTSDPELPAVRALAQ